jgi:hydroxyacylglutathione hydrolase
MKTCSVQELQKALSERPAHTHFLDVRSSAEYAEGHIPGFENAVLTGEKVKSMNLDDTYYVQCFSGGRSSFVCMQMEKLGFKNVINVKGGLSAWEEAGYDIAKGA